MVIMPDKHYKVVFAWTYAGGSGSNAIFIKRSSLTDDDWTALGHEFAWEYGYETCTVTKVSEVSAAEAHGGRVPVGAR